MTLQELETLATTQNTLTIGWEHLARAADRNDFEVAMAHAMSHIADLERIYEELLAGEGDMLQPYVQVIQSELLAGYELRQLWQRYETIQLLTGD